MHISHDRSMHILRAWRGYRCMRVAIAFRAESARVSGRRWSSGLTTRGRKGGEGLPQRRDIVSGAYTCTRDRGGWARYASTLVTLSSVRIFADCTRGRHVESIPGYPDKQISGGPRARCILRSLTHVLRSRRDVVGRIVRRKKFQRPRHAGERFTVNDLFPFDVSSALRCCERVARN